MTRLAARYAPLGEAQTMSVVAAFELDELCRLAGRAMRDEVVDWLIDREPATALQAVRELNARLALDVGVVPTEFPPVPGKLNATGLRLLVASLVVVWTAIALAVWFVWPVVPS